MSVDPLDFASLQPGAECCGLVYVDQIQRKLTKYGKPYLTFRLRDHQQRVLDGRKWDVTEQEAYRYPGLLYVEGMGDAWNGHSQVKIDYCQERDGDDSAFVPRPYRDAGSLTADLRALVESVTDPALAAVLCRCGPIFSAFAAAPASLRYHGDYPGGLLEHTVNVASICAQVAERYGDVVDRDLLLTGALLHDVGKLDAYDDTGTTQSDDERLLGHVVRGILLVNQLTEGLAGLEAGRRSALLHLIASHHGQKDWGAPTEPATVEAYILHYADQIDASVTGLRDAVREALPGERWVFFQMRKNHVLRPECRASDRPDRRPEHDEDGFIDIPF